MSQERFLYRELSYKIIGIGMKVHTELGPGFLEKVYENSMMVLFAEEGIHAVQQHPIEVVFHGCHVGQYFADILVEDSIILELKAAEATHPIHRAQTLNYLKATGLRVGYLFNFGKRSLEFERLVF